jgi:cyclic beta-1,2-glucan synthetase
MLLARLWLRLRTCYLPRAAGPWVDESILRDEILSVERLEGVAASLAAIQPLQVRGGAHPALHWRLRDNESVLLGAYRSTAAAARAGSTITPAAEWLLDNYHLVEEQIRDIRHDLPVGYYRQLPRLATGLLAGYPRVLEVTWVFVSHTDSRLDPVTLQRFLDSYQRVQPLTIGELWAIAITLRIVLIENLRRSVVRTLNARAARAKADAIADRLLGVNGCARDPYALRDIDDVGDADNGFTAQLVQRLRDQDPRETPALQWLEEHLQARGTSSEAVVNDEHQRQGASNVTVRNIITSMRLVSDIDWAAMFESVSLVDAELGIYAGYAEMDFATRNQYRSAIEEFARHCPLTELEVARSAVVTGPEDGGPEGTCAEQARDPGYRLIGAGRNAFQTAIGFIPSLRARIGGQILAHGAGCYVSSVLVAGASALAAAVGSAFRCGATAPVACLVLIGALPALDVAVALVNRLWSRYLPVTRLPGLVLRGAIPAELRTLVVIPVILTGIDSVIEYTDRLEVHFLGSPEGAIHFALLADFPDSAQEEDAIAEGLRIAADARIARLNARHPAADGGARFFLLHRRRVWSGTQGAWLGWERKRGKLHELNRLLRGAVDTTFNAPGSLPPALPATVRYVLTLDSDTRLPPDTVRRLIGKIGHPLNRPRFDALAGRVVEGYAILQPRVTPSLPMERAGSLFSTVYSSECGVDPYSVASSDVYQDLIGEGSYTGKGIYEIDPFEAALAGRVPVERMLSHDLFEGIFARAALASDVEVVEEYPLRYDVATRRSHRWIRGDWQLLPWILGLPVRDGASALLDYRLSLISRWKMLDNIRRSLSAPGILIAMLAGAAMPLRAALIWCGLVTLAVAIRPLLPVLSDLFGRPQGMGRRAQALLLLTDLRAAAMQVGLDITFLPHQAASALDAIGRTLYRILVSHSRLLEWTTAEYSARAMRLDLPSMYRYMSAGIWLPLVLGGASAIVEGRAPYVAAPLLLLWILAPLVAVVVSRQYAPPGPPPLSETDARALRQVARMTWRYFEKFVTADHQWLPPDNVQEDPAVVTANRTSPTNIGLYLLSTVSACDFGWIGVSEASHRISATLQTISRMQRFRGHLYNWYDTADLRPLEPRYVSTVDSGNLAAHLIAVANAADEWCRLGLASSAVNQGVAGVRDALAIAQSIRSGLPRSRDADALLRRELDETLGMLLARQEANPATAEEASRAWLAAALPRVGSALDLARAVSHHCPASQREQYDEFMYWVEAAERCIRSVLADSAGPAAAESLLSQLQASALSARAIVMGMDFACLLNPERRLLSIGMRTADGGLDPACYDLLGSEARLAVFIAIAKRDIPARSWFRLGRGATRTTHGPALTSWSGSMFEYLMPSLVMATPAGSLLGQTGRRVVERQIEYGAGLGIPWGVSESAYNARDIELTYQYSNFGVPGLGLRRGLSNDLVVAPYATALAAMVDPSAAAANFEVLAVQGARGRYGFFEAIDFTRKRLPATARSAVVHAFMAHHQGMTIVSLANAVLGERMRDRFHAEPIVQATELLLQERPPRYVPLNRDRAEDVFANVRATAELSGESRFIRTPHDAVPQTHVLSNGRYSVMLTSVGSGYTRWNGFAITRWVEDATRDNQGSYLFLRDIVSGSVWSAGFQPTGASPDSYEVRFPEDRALFMRTDGTLSTVLEALVSPEHDAEVRRVAVTNHGYRVREIEFTSYSELSLSRGSSDLAHMAFSKLFIQTEFLSAIGALLATRRHRSPGEAPVWVAQHAVVEGDQLADVEIETDRARFIGRGREIHSAIALEERQPLSESVGAVLDPIFAFRHRLRIPPGGTVRIALWTMAAESRDQVLCLVDKYREANAFARASTLAWTQAQVQLRHLGVETAEASLFQRLAGHLLYVNGAMRPGSDYLQRGIGPPGAIWSQGISGDLPIVLLKVDDLDDMGITRQLLRAHEYWRTKQLSVDLVILNDRGASYAQDLEVALATAVRSSQSRPRIGADGAHGAVFLLRGDRITRETETVLTSIARVVLNAADGSLEEQLDRARAAVFDPVRWPRVDVSRRRALAPPPPPPGDVEFYNGIGGFSENGREYVALLGGGQATPAPWLNVVSNSTFGFQVTAEGGGYTWAQNSREHKLTPWSNDPVSDYPGEALYVRDEETGELWGPTSSPILDRSAHYRATHGQGFSRFHHESHGIQVELVQFVPLEDAVKVSKLRLTNRSRRPRILSVTSYTEWVLGTARSTSAPTIVTSRDSESGALLASNPWSQAFGARVAFVDMRGIQSDWTCDRREFIGRHGRLAAPAALLRRGPMSRRAGGGFDPCAVLQAPVRLAAGESVEVSVFLGEAASRADALELVRRYRAMDLDESLAQVRAYWDETLGAVQVSTPNRAFDVIVNSWALYQAIACRLWARAAFYQASGAYGFRDQLQDAMAIAAVAPALTREHIVRAAGRQFAPGDVQHWWQPTSGEGVRTRISDDSVWLAHAVLHYVMASGDAEVLEVPIPFLAGRGLAADEVDAYFQPHVDEADATLYEHCARGIDHGLATGAHGLPLIGTGDWNDGMNLVGSLGAGESVWLAWFVSATVTGFIDIADRRGDHVRVSRWRTYLAENALAIANNAWDGAWYRRGYFDDGAALGSAGSDECHIDSIAQSWSVIAGAGDQQRARVAMDSLDRLLIDRNARLAVLFAPPFDKTSRDPGYIKGYPPGIRENGGQYSHAAAWTVLALAKLGDGNRALEVWSMINPIARSSSRADAIRYMVEPYAVAADVYSCAPHVGRGGWTWYTGAAGLLHRAALEGILGVRRRGSVLELSPSIPTTWPTAAVVMRCGAARYNILIKNPSSVSAGIARIRFDGAALPPGSSSVPFVDDGLSHEVEVVLGQIV